MRKISLLFALLSILLFAFTTQSFAFSRKSLVSAMKEEGLDNKQIERILQKAKDYSKPQVQKVHINLDQLRDFITRSFNYKPEYRNDRLNLFLKVSDLEKTKPYYYERGGTRYVVYLLGKVRAIQPFYVTTEGGKGPFKTPEPRFSRGEWTQVHKGDFFFLKGKAIYNLDPNSGWQPTYLGYVIQWKGRGMVSIGFDLISGKIGHHEGPL